MVGVDRETLLRPRKKYGDPPSGWDRQFGAAGDSRNGWIFAYLLPHKGPEPHSLERRVGGRRLQASDRKVKERWRRANTMACWRGRCSAHQQSLGIEQARTNERRFRRLFAPFGLNEMRMATDKDASRIGAESWWRGGILLSLFGAGPGTNDFAEPRKDESDGHWERAENTAGGGKTATNSCAARRRRRHARRCPRSTDSLHLERLRDPQDVPGASQWQLVPEQWSGVMSAGTAWRARCDMTPKAQRDRKSHAKKRERGRTAAQTPYVVVGHGSSRNSV